MNENQNSFDQSSEPVDVFTMQVKARVPAGAIAWYVFAGIFFAGSVIMLALTFGTSCDDTDTACRIMSLTYITGTFFGFMFALMSAVLGYGTQARARNARREKPVTGLLEQ
jgi:hypothetical protein